MTNEKIILLDIDKTLLDTALLMTRTEKMLADFFKISLSEAATIKREYAESDTGPFHFDPRELVELYDSPRDLKEKVIFEYENNAFLYPKFADVLPALRLLNKKKYRIGIFSEGTPYFQELKLKNLGISHFIDKELVFIAQSKRDPQYLKDLPLGCFIVDDNPEVIEILHSFGEVKPIFLDRKEKVLKEFTSIKTLTELDTLL